MWLEGREGVVGDLRAGSRDARDERRLARVREADKGNVGHQLQLELEPPLLADLSLLCKGRSPEPVGEEARVAAAAPPSFGSQQLVAGEGKVGDHVTIAKRDDCALGHGHDQVCAPPPVAGLAHPVRAVAGPAVWVVAEPEQ